MHMKKNYLHLVLIFTIFCFVNIITLAADDLILYTPFTGLYVSPGDTAKYTITIINETNQIQNFTLTLEGLSEDWNYLFKNLSREIEKMSVRSKNLEDNSRNIDLEVEVPLMVEEGVHHFQLVARTDTGLKAVLPLQVNVKEKGVFETEFTINQPNMEGYSDSTFTYSAKLVNKTPERQHYSLTASAPRGWDVRFRVNAEYVTSVTLDSNSNQNVSIHVKPPANVEAGTYNINVRAISGQTIEEIQLEAVIKGKYGINLTTPIGVLSTDIPIGGEKEIELIVENTGTVPLRDINLSASTPIDWTVEFEEEEIVVLEAGDKRNIKATIKASDKAIAGDYQLLISARTPEASASRTFRITAKTSMFWGAVGILIIFAVIAILYYFIRKYGRR